MECTTLELPVETHASVETALGTMALAIGPGGLRGLTFGHPEADSAIAALAGYTASSSRSRRLSVDAIAGDAVSDPADWVPQLIDQLQSYAAGDPIDFLETPLDFSGVSMFQRAVLIACRAIPYGRTSTYAALAAAAGSPVASRAVGRTMATNRWPLIVPCHRVLATGGGLRGYSAVGGLATKRRLLDMEYRGASSCAAGYAP